MAGRDEIMAAAKTEPPPYMEDALKLRASLAKVELLQGRLDELMQTVLDLAESATKFGRNEEAADLKLFHQVFTEAWAKEDGP
jgi:hypothetical protein